MLLRHNENKAPLPNQYLRRDDINNMNHVGLSAKNNVITFWIFALFILKLIIAKWTFYCLFSFDVVYVLSVYLCVQ